MSTEPSCFLIFSTAGSEFALESSKDLEPTNRRRMELEAFASGEPTIQAERLPTVLTDSPRYSAFGTKNRNAMSSRPDRTSSHNEGVVPLATLSSSRGAVWSIRGIFGASQYPEIQVAAPSATGPSSAASFGNSADRTSSLCAKNCVVAWWSRRPSAVS